MSNRNIGNMIREEREKQRLSLKELAEIIGCSEKHLGQVERGYNEPSIQFIQRIEKALYTTFVTDEYLDFLKGEERRLLKDLFKIYNKKFNQDINIDEILNDYSSYKKARTKLRNCYKQIIKGAENNDK